MVTVINPQGQPPAAQQMPMARRLESLEGKTVYLVDVRWPYTHQFLEELYKVLSQRYSTTKFVMRDKAGSYGETDPKLWAEIQEQGNAAIVAVGH
jgi:hypothetical protein